VSLCVFRAPLQYAVEGSRGDVVEVIRSFCQIQFEITLLTVVQNNNPTLFCAPIGHRQEREIIKKAGSLQQF
jgi:formate-dependent phosphoribosylglycinamide formyltransferase (GAR transformylase)